MPTALSTRGDVSAGPVGESQEAYRLDDRVLSLSTRPMDSTRDAKTFMLTQVYEEEVTNYQGHSSLYFGGYLWQLIISGVSRVEMSSCLSTEIMCRRKSAWRQCPRNRNDVVSMQSVVLTMEHYSEKVLICFFLTMLKTLDN